MYRRKKNYYSTFAGYKYSAYKRFATLHPLNFHHRSEVEIREFIQLYSVCLQSLTILDTNITGVIHVLNHDYRKEVLIRYTIDGWSSYTETHAGFSSIVDSNIDSFCFFLALPNDMPEGEVCEFCIQYNVQNVTYWDNNFGQNYKLVWG
uniref:CBM21 domain-containing protein n=1 Tax=Syphacia muris TaxID=451379 RepID=A0A0N5AIR4_9BILA